MGGNSTSLQLDHCFWKRKYDQFCSDTGWL